jgi:hypothetical protein
VVEISSRFLSTGMKSRTRTIRRFEISENIRSAGPENVSWEFYRHVSTVCRHNEFLSIHDKFSSIHNLEDQIWSKLFFWSHNPIFSHHLKKSSHFSSASQEICSTFDPHNLVFRFDFSLADQMSSIWSTDLVGEPKDQISWYSHPVHSVIARNQLLC